RDDGYGERDLHEYRLTSALDLSCGFAVSAVDVSPLYGKRVPEGDDFVWLCAGNDELEHACRHSGQHDGGVTEVLAQQALGERLQCFSGFGQGEVAGSLVPLKLVAGGLG